MSQQTPIDEPQRLARLQALSVLDTPAEAVFDSFTRAAAVLCDVPIALVSLVDEHRQWFKSNLGLEDVCETARDISFCTVALSAEPMLEIPDALLDERFRRNPLVLGEPHIRFYAGVPLAMPGGERVGTLCVLDRRPRQLSDAQRAALQDLARGVSQALLLREAAHRRAHASSEELFRALSQSCPVGIYHTDARGQCIYSNTEWQRLSGLSAQQSLGDGWQRAIHPDDLPGLLAHWQRQSSSGTDFDMNVRLRSADGTVLHVRSRARPVHLPDGTTSGYVGSVEDVSARHEVEDRLRASNAFLARAEQVSGVGGWEMDLRNRSLKWTAQTCRIYGLDPGFQPTADEHFKYFDPASRELMQRTADTCIISGQPWDLELPMVTAQGRHVWIRSVGQAEFEDGRPVRLVGALQDITAKRAMEDELRSSNAQLRLARDAADAANRAKSEFLATMSHEIRTPLNGIIGLTRFLLEDRLSSAQRQHAELIDGSAQSLMALINDFLDFSKIEAGQLSMESVAFDLHALLAELGRLFEHRANEKSLAFQLDLAPSVPRHVRGDATRLRQVVTNLLGNALKFTAVGRIAMQAEAAPLAAGRALLRVAVSDTGIGIPDQVRQRLFTRFTQADSSTSRKYGGTGLGLAIVKQLCELLGGQVSLHSVVGEGSTFVVELPVELAQAEPAAPPSPQAARPGRGVRLLLAEDNPTNQIVALGVLRKLGYADVAVVPDGQQAVDKGLAQRFDAILMDCQMPGMDGYQATQMLRAQGCDTPIIAMTANAIQGDRERCIAAGMDDYLAKPIDRQALGETLARWTRVHSSNSGLAPLAELPAAGAAIFDRAALTVHFGNDQELVEVAVRSFLEHTPRLIDGLYTAVAAGRHEEVVRLAHSAQGSSAMMCAPALQGTAGAIERLGLEGNLDALPPLLQRLEAGFADFRREAEAG